MEFSEIFNILQLLLKHETIVKTSFENDMQTLKN